ncbi:MAG: hypothetical protein SNH94_03325 [Rikenellaceae bacterium]
MFIILPIALLVAIIYFWSAQIHRAKLRSSLRFIDDNSPRLRISVVACKPQSVNYIASLLKSESTAYQVIIVADFEKQASLLRQAIEYFGLFKTSLAPNGEIEEGAIRNLLRSHRRLFAKLIVVDSPHSSSYTPFEVGAAISSYNYNLQIHSRRGLQPQAIENMLLELATRPEESVEQITSALGERFKLICREAALHKNAGKIEVKPNRRIKVNYRILK